MRQVVGIDRKIKRAWLDATLDRLAQGTDGSELRTFLDKHLKEELPGKESRAKAVGIVLKIWSSVPRERLPLRDRAVAILPNISGEERVWLHLGMAALAYPFFRDTAEVVGRLLALQDDFTTAQVQARMLTTWGDRVTSKLAARYLLNTFVDWDVLRSTKTKGHFLLTRKMTTSNPDLQLWLLESLLWASAADEIEAQQLLRMPESFPFVLSVGVSDLRKHDSFDIHRQGLDMDMVALRKVIQEPPPKPTKKSTKGKTFKPNQPSLFDRHVEEVAFGDRKPAADSILPNTRSAKKKKHSNSDERSRVEDSIPSPDGPFSAPSTECAEQFRDEHYFGCIALTQAVIEAVIRHIWQINLKKKPNQEGSFEKNLLALHKKKFISDEWKSKLDQMWAERHSFLHLRRSVESDQQMLKNKARNMLKLLNELEQEFFGFPARDGLCVARQTR